ncbi:MAG: 30S ribosomal protein S1 [Bacteroidota bacterium]|nr:30S ribosomal protein S1 [Bacteroidota bacterium]
MSEKIDKTNEENQEVDNLKETTDKKQNDEKKEAITSEKESAEKAEETEKKAEDTEQTEKKDDESKQTITENLNPENESTMDFDWDSASSDIDDYSVKERTQMADVYSNTLSTINEKEIVDGSVVSVSDREVVINIGYKSEGVVNKNEFRYNEDLAKGDTVEVYIESQEDREGQLILSHKKARTLNAWKNINNAHEEDRILKGYIKCRTKGGMIVDVFGIEAFLPGSQIDVKPIRDYDAFVDKTMEFKVVQINKEYKNVVVSHKALIEAELEEQKQKIIEQLEKGQVLKGMVKNITSYGVFIDLGGVDGLIHITDLSWGRINHPEEVVELDQELNVVILDYDENKKRIALGLKQLEPHPWDSLDPDLKVGDHIKGRVVVITDYGAFVEIKPGVEGLVHVSEMSWSQHLRSAQDFLNVNDEVEAEILTLDREERKMSLGMKQLKPDPWENIVEKYPVGSKHKTKVKNFTNFGIFVELEEGVDGLIHISDLSWTKKVKHPAEFTKIGEEIEVVVLDVDSEGRKLSLGHKQLEENPWDVFETLFKERSIHEGTVVNIGSKEAIIALPYGVEGICYLKNLKKEEGESMAAEEKAEFKVLEFKKDSKKIVVSHVHSYKKDLSTGSKSKKPDIESTTLGDISNLSQLKDELSGNKDD